jgi:hypothetical protein
LDGLVGGFIADIANMSCSELEELWVSAFLAFKEVFFVGLECGGVEDGIEGGFHELLWLGWDDRVLLENDLFTVLGLSLE